MRLNNLQENRGGDRIIPAKKIHGGKNSEMKDYKSEFIRNVAFCGHGRSGKTTLLEAALFNSGATTRLGNVDNGTSVLDYEPEETKRKMSISAALAAVEWKNFKLNALDVPGFPDFVAEMHGALAAADAVVIVVSASAGVEVETEKAWALAESLNLPRAFFVTKMDREHADFDKVLTQLRDKFGNSVVPVQVPVGKEDSFSGVVDLIKVFSKVDANDEAVDAADVADEVEDKRLEMLDTVAEFNDDLMEKYLEGDVEDLDEAEISDALAQGIREVKVFPVFVGSALKNVGIKKFLNSIVEFFPAPDAKDYSGINPKTDELVERKVSEPFSGQIFKTMVDPFVGQMSYVRHEGRRDVSTLRRKFGRAGACRRTAHHAGQEANFRGSCSRGRYRRHQQTCQRENRRHSLRQSRPDKIRAH